MTRPASHRDLRFEKRCANCRFSHWLDYKDDLLCFHGDTVVAELTERDTGKSAIKSKRLMRVLFDGKSVGRMQGDEYDKVWGSRVVDPELEVCDEWQPWQPQELAVNPVEHEQTK